LDYLKIVEYINDISDMIHKLIVLSIFINEDGFTSDELRLMARASGALGERLLDELAEFENNWIEPQ
jgi:hypothetical protein